MKPLCLFITLLIFTRACDGRSSAQLSYSAIQGKNVNLSRIQHIAPKGRIQDKDYNNIEVVDQLIVMNTQAIPYLIERLDDETEMDRKVMDFWSSVTVADVALVILADFFTDSTWKKTTIPGVGWDEMLERKNARVTGEEVLREFLAKHGRKAIKVKWQRIWNESKNRLYWDQNERCFRLR